MRALSLIQPWATLLVLGAKRGGKGIETRSWCTAYTGPLLIHASKGFPRGSIELCRERRFAWALGKAGILNPGDLPRGAIIGSVFLQGYYSTRWDAGRIPAVGSDEYEFGDFGPDRFMWDMRDPVRFAEPIPCKGALGLWTVPDDIESLVRQQMPGME